MEISINGIKFKINIDTKYSTQKLMRQIEKDPTNNKTDQRLEAILRDLLIPSPTYKQILDFRRSDIRKVFEKFSDAISEEEKEVKKKLSR